MKEKNDEYILTGMYAWTKSQSSDGRLVGVGNADSDGSYVYSSGPGYSDSDLGVSVSRRR